MKFQLSLVALLLIIPSLVHSQSDDHWTENIYYGGNLGLSFGNITYIDISPMIGYQVSDYYSAGVTFTYQYFNDKRIDISGNVIGGGIFNRFHITEEFFLHAEYQNLSYSELNAISDNGSNDRLTVPYLWLGAGFNQRVGGSAAIFVSFLYDVIQDPNGLLQNPQIRGGVTLGI